MQENPKCPRCAYRREIENDINITCVYDWDKSEHQMPKSTARGKVQGQFAFPQSFDPLWMEGDCPAFSTEADESMIATSIRARQGVNIEIGKSKRE